MCSRYSLTSPPEAVRAYFKHVNTVVFPPRYNIAPTQPVPIIRPSATGDREFTLVRWGLIPSWVKDPKTFSLLINARAETALNKPSFRGAMRHKRCLVPADAFYEWTGPQGRRRPYLIRPRDGGLMAFAGLYELWHNADGSEMESLVILTVPANRKISVLHDRMPAIVTPESFGAWLNVKSVEASAAAAFLVPAAEHFLETVEVSPKVNNPRNDNPEVQEPAAPRLL
jgi:putative SOS response-associated peptidase YedK